MNKKKSLIIIGICLFIAIVVGVSYAYWRATLVTEKKAAMTTNCIIIDFSSSSDAIDLSDAEPISDRKARNLETFDFTIQNTCNNDILYHLNLEDLEGTTLDDKYVRMVFNNGSPITLTDVPEADAYLPDAISARMLDSGKLESKEIKAYTLKLYLYGETAVDEDSMNKLFKAKVSAIGSLPEFIDPYVSVIADKSIEYQYRNAVKTINFVDHLDIPENAIETWDYSQNEDETIMGYVLYHDANEEVNITTSYWEDEIVTGSYDLYIASDKKMRAPRVMNLLFSEFINLETVNNLDLVDFSYVEDAKRSFFESGYNSTKFDLDLSDANFESLKDTSLMFIRAGGLATEFSLILGDNFDTSKVTDMSLMFYHLNSSLSHEPTSPFVFDLGDKFDTSNVTDMHDMFGGFGYFADNLTLDLGDKFDTSKVKDMSGMFYCFGRLANSINLNLGDKFSIDNVEDVRWTFSDMGINIEWEFDVSTFNFKLPRDIMLFELINFDRPRTKDLTIVYSTNEQANFVKSLNRDFIKVKRKEGTNDTSYTEIPTGTLCKRATTLHTATCSDNSKCGFTSVGASTTFGRLGSGSTLTTGDAFDCDVNGDGVYDSEKERFYYLKDMDSNNAIMIYYTNTVDGEVNPDNPSMLSYSKANEDWYAGINGPNYAVLDLPKRSQWTNVTLVNPIRNITTHDNVVTYSNYSYEYFSARLPAYSDLAGVCDKTTKGLYDSFDTDCEFLAEQALTSSGKWITHPSWSESMTEIPRTERDVYGNVRAWVVHDTFMHSIYGSFGGYGAKPVIEVPKTRIQLN